MSESNFEDYVKDLRGMYRGIISLPDDDEFEKDIGYVFNKEFVDRKPAIVFKPRGVSDVQKAIRFARNFDLPVAVKCAGHNGSGSSSTHGGVLINLGMMRACHVDVESKTIMAEGGCTLGDVDAELESFNLAVPVGTYQGTGLGGVALHGGIGHLMRKLNHSLTDSIVEMKVVLADGSTATCNKTVNQDLFWAMKGSGGNFAIVTSFIFKCFPIEPSAYGGFRIQTNVDLVERLNNWARLLSEEKNFSAITYLLNPPDGPPDGLVAQHVIHYDQDQDKVEKQIKSITCGDTVPDFGNFERQTYHSCNFASRKLLDCPPPSNQYWRLFLSPVWTNEHSAIADKAFKYIRENPIIANGSLIVIERWDRNAKDHPHSSWNYDGSHYVFEVVVGWFGHENKDAGMKALEEVTDIVRDGGHWKTISELGMGYANYSMTYSDTSEEDYVNGKDRLRAVKAKYDRDNMFSKGKFAKINS